MMRLCYFGLACLVFSGTLAKAQADETILGCGSFTDDAKYYNFQLVDRYSETRTDFAIPSEFFEFYQKKGEVFGAYTDTFYVNFHDFSSATSSLERRLGKKFKDTIWFGIQHARSDFPLEKLALNRLADESTPSGYPNSIEGPSGLRWFDTKTWSFSERPDKDHYIARDEAGMIVSYINCSSPKSPVYARPGCLQYFHSDGMQIQAYYSVNFIAEWRYVQDGVSAFLRCGLDQAQHLKAK